MGVRARIADGAIGGDGLGTPASGRHSGPQGRGRFLAVRLDGAQTWDPQRCERCLPFPYTDYAERWDSRREGTTSELGVLPAARPRRAVPAGGRRSRAAVTTLHLRRSASAPFHARRGVQADPIMGVFPGGGRHRGPAGRERALSNGRMARPATVAALRTDPARPFLCPDSGWSAPFGTRRFAGDGKWRAPFVSSGSR